MFKELKNGQALSTQPASRNVPTSLFSEVLLELLTILFEAPWTVVQ